MEQRHKILFDKLITTLVFSPCQMLSHCASSPITRSSKILNREVLKHHFNDKKQLTWSSSRRCYPWWRASTALQGTLGTAWPPWDGSRTPRSCPSPFLGAQCRLGTRLRTAEVLLWREIWSHMIARGKFTAHLQSYAKRLICLNTGLWRCLIKHKRCYCSLRVF